MPPTNIKTDLSVGDPVKNLDTSEPNESMARSPIMTSTIPPITKTIDMILFIAHPIFRVYCCNTNVANIHKDSYINHGV